MTPTPTKKSVEEEDTLSFEAAMAALCEDETPQVDPSSLMVDEASPQDAVEPPFDAAAFSEEVVEIAEVSEPEPKPDPADFYEACPPGEDPKEWEKVLADRRRTPVEMRQLPVYGQIVAERLWVSREIRVRPGVDD